MHRRMPQCLIMLDMVRSSVRYEIATVLDLGVSAVIDTAYKSGNLVSSYEKQAGVIEKKMANALKNFTENR